MNKQDGKHISKIGHQKKEIREKKGKALKAKIKNKLKTSIHFNL